MRETYKYNKGVRHTSASVKRACRPTLRAIGYADAAPELCASRLCATPQSSLPSAAVVIRTGGGCRCADSLGRHVGADCQRRRDRQLTVRHHLARALWPADAAAGPRARAACALIGAARPGGTHAQRRRSGLVGLGRDLGRDLGRGAALKMPTDAAACRAARRVLSRWLLCYS